jgi:hypothetical protein
MIISGTYELFCPAVDVQCKHEQRQGASVIIEQAQVLPAAVVLVGM